MVERITRNKEIYLDGTVFPITGQIQEMLVSQWPSKVVIGEYAQEDEPLLSSWVTSDQRGGILVEEMEEDIHGDRAWWSNLELRYRGHRFLPVKATQLEPLTLETPTITNADMELTSGWTGGSRSSTQKYSGSYSWKCDGQTAYQDLDGWQAGIKYTFTAWVYGSSVYQNRVHLEINDGVGTTTVDATHGALWKQMSVTRTLAPNATGLRVQFRTESAIVGYMDDVAISIAGMGAPGKFAIYNGKQYLAMGATLVGLNTDGDGYEIVTSFDYDILDLVPALGVLFILLGDGAGGDSRLTDDETDTSTSWDVDDATGFAVNDYARCDYEVVKITAIATNKLTVTRAQWGTTGAAHTARTRVIEARKSKYMKDDESTADCNVPNARLGIEWDDKFFFMDKLNQMAFLTSPSGNLTQSGRIKNLADNATKQLRIYRKATGEPVIYAGTTTGLWVHDYDNAKWVQTELVLPNHPSCGQGLRVWRDAIFISAGLTVYKYICAQTSTITTVGLDRDDGLPSKYRGEITGLAPGFNELYATVDASLVSDVAYSSIMAYDGSGWFTIWVDNIINRSINHSIVSSIPDYRYWFIVGDKVYYIPLQRNIRNPKQIPDFPYNEKGIHISSWFDANTIYPKLAVRHKVETKDLTDTETVTIKYRIDHQYTDVDSGWATLATLKRSGDVEIPFGKEGLVFRAIQFREELVRGDDVTKSPDILKTALHFQRTLPPRYGWQVTVDCKQDYRNKTSAQLQAELKKLLEKQTLSEFTYRDDVGGKHTHYVRVMRSTVTSETGRDWRGEYNLALIAP